MALSSSSFANFFEALGHSSSQLVEYVFGTLGLV